MKWTIKRFFKTTWIIAGIIFMFWIFYSYQAQDVDKYFLQNDSLISIEDTKDFYSFTPTNKCKSILIFFPGAMVETKAYAPLCRKIAENNIKVYLIKMPWRLASKGYNKPKELGLLNDTTKKTILSGHSQGGKMAAQFVYENPDLIDKLILIGTSHPRDISLKDSKTDILKIYGTNDGIAKKEEISANKSKLPNTTKFTEIIGANHSQFGYYGFQLGDNKATINREQQQKETLKSILEFINEQAENS